MTEGVYIMKKQKEKRISGGYLLSVAAFAATIGIFGTGVFFFSGKADEEGAETLRKGIARAAVQCYAIEGRYPPSVEYLEENYGIQIDRSRYHVLYEGFASNIMPNITVLRIEEP